MKDGPHSLDIEATLNRMEPGVSIPAIEQSLASIAISMKRIADMLDTIGTNELRGDTTMHRDMQELISAVRNNHQRIFYAEKM